jgi:hypothetical protein
MVEPTRLRQLLDEFRFEDVEQLLNEDTDPDLANEIAARRAEAEKRAEVVVRRLVELGEKGQLDEFVAMVDDPVTKRLITQASGSSRDRVNLYVQEAERWRRHQIEVNAKRLGEARRALDGLDLGLAEGLMRKIDERFLTDEGHEERDQLLLEMSARAMEIESLGRAGGKQKQPHRDGRRAARRRRK